jgi:phage portal protein BeeE
MNFLDKIFNRSAAQSEPSLICLSSSPEREAIDYSVKESRADKINYRGIGATEYGAGTPPAFYDAALDAVGKFPLVYGCVTAISEAIAALSVKVYLIDGGERVEEVDHPFYQLFTNPNPYQGSFEFLEEVQQSLDVTGNVFIAKEKVAGTYELYVLNPQYVAIIPDPKKKVKQYI